MPHLRTSESQAELSRFEARCLLPDGYEAFPINPKFKDIAHDQEN